VTGRRGPAGFAQQGNAEQLPHPEPQHGRAWGWAAEPVATEVEFVDTPAMPSSKARRIVTVPRKTDAISLLPFNCRSSLSATEGHAPNIHADG